MDDAIKFTGVDADESLQGISYAVSAGSLAAVITSRQEDCDLQARLIMGLAAAWAGTVTVLGQEVIAASERRATATRRQVAVVYPTGGLISNLKVWENLVLPLEYHFSYGPQETEERGVAALRRVGYTGGAMELPGHLSLYERKQVGLARAMLTEPAVVVYNAMLDGISRGEQSALMRAAVEFHRESPHRTSLFLTAHQETLKDIPLDMRIVIKGGCAADD